MISNDQATLEKNHTGEVLRENVYGACVVGASLPTRTFTRKIYSQGNVMLARICECLHGNVHGANVNHFQGCTF